jgi:hypothetical protein
MWLVDESNLKFNTLDHGTVKSYKKKQVTKYSWYTLTLDWYDRH